MATQQIERGRIESDAPMSFHVDGEPAEGGTALEIRVLPRRPDSDRVRRT